LFALISGLKGPGIPSVIHQSIRKCNINVQKELCSNIVACGGTSQLPGFQERMQQETKLLLPASLEVKVNCSTESHIGAWIGGSIVASLCSFGETCVLREQYEELGPHSVSQKCTNFYR